MENAAQWLSKGYHSVYIEVSLKMMFALFWGEVVEEMEENVQEGTVIQYSIDKA